MARMIICTSLQALLLLSRISCSVQQDFTTDKLSTDIPEEIVFSSSFSEAVSDTTDVYVDSKVEDISTVTNDKYEQGTNPSSITDIMNTKINTYENNLVDSNGTTESLNAIQNELKNEEEILVRNPETTTPVNDWTEIINSIKRTMNVLNKTRPVPNKVEVLDDYDVHVNREDINSDGNEHPCTRECKEGESMICYYHFRIEWYHTLSKACYNCPYNESDCSRKDCIPADGMSRPITVINRKMPGPAIEVCQGDRIIVDVENDLMVEGTTVHWHGQHQRDTPFMDGTPHVTQCPILPETTFRYQFFANNSGTHFWHSHSGMQRADGAAGALIVRTPISRDRHQGLYDYDRCEHTMIITDWVHQLSLDMFTDHHHSKGDNKPPTLLINGLGRFKVFNTTTKPMYMRAARFNVEQGFKYRFRVINAEFLNCPIEISVDNHNITLIASDGHDLQPVTATSLVTYAGERFDFIIEASEEIDNYWIRFRGLMDCDERFTKAKQVAVLHYEGAMEDEPPGNLTWEESHNDGIQINALNKGEEENETISVSELRSLDNDDETLKEKADYQFYVAYDFYPKNNSHFHKSPYYGYYQVPHMDNRLYTPQLNHISMKLPSSPLLVSRPSDEGFCNSTTITEECKQGYCECHHVLEVKTGSVVEVIIIDEGVTFDANHPFHLHGHSFRVVGLRRLASQITVEEVKAYDEAGLLKRNLKHAPIKDTVTVPDGGYTVIRFKADNPGYWLFHCHIEFHAEIGMSLVFKVGEHDEMAQVPPHFPTCGDYIPDNMIEKITLMPPLSDDDEDNSYISLTHWWPLLYLNSTTTDSLPAQEAASGSIQTISIILISLCLSKQLLAFW